MVTSDVDPYNFSTQDKIQGAPCTTQAKAVNHECSGITCRLHKLGEYNLSLLTVLMEDNCSIRIY